jgi:hypothetical protein
MPPDSHSGDMKKIKWAEDLAPEIISFKSKYKGAENGRRKRIG